MQANPVSARTMAVFDALPAEFRRFLADYPRGVPAPVAMAAYTMAGGDVDAAREIVAEMAPVRREAGQ